MVKDLDTNEPINAPDTGMQFYLSGHSGTNTVDREATLYALCESWSGFSSRSYASEGNWISGLSGYLEAIAEKRAAHVQKWIYQNLDRFKASHTSLETLRRTCDTVLIELKENIHLCKAQCSSCNLLCLQSHGHDTQHNCQTSHCCPYPCPFGDEHPGEEKKCGFRYVMFCNNLTLITHSQCWTLRTTRVRQGLSGWCYCTYPLVLIGVLLTFTCAENHANSAARKGVWVDAPRSERTHMPTTGSW